MSVLSFRSRLHGAYPVDQSPVPDFDEKGEPLEHAAEQAVPEDLGVWCCHLQFPAHEAELPSPPLGWRLAGDIFGQGAARAAAGPAQGGRDVSELVVFVLAAFDVLIICIRDVFEVLPWLRPTRREWRPGEGPVLVAVDDSAKGQQADHDERFQDGAECHVARPIGNWEQSVFRQRDVKVLVQKQG